MATKKPGSVYESPLVARNASLEMSELFGARRRILTWRRLWIALAEAQREVGLKQVKAGQIQAMKRALDRIDFKRAAKYEARFRHDVMAHIHAFGDAAPAARGIIHLGATSAFVVDNGDLILMREALRLIEQWLAGAILALADFAKKNRSLPTLGFTHYQPAQLTTVGKRACLWSYDLVRDLEDIVWRIERMKFRGTKGATGTQASFLALFDGNEKKVDRLERLVARKMGFTEIEPVTGQTYSRKVDAQVVSTLAGIAASVHKFANDIRLLANLKEIEEPFETSQVGSSAMAYKRNPMRCERATGLARWVLSLAGSPLLTAAEQWFERTLDDSSNKRLSVPEAFLATDGMLRIVTNVARGLVVYPNVIGARVAAELPFMATEDILMAGVANGGDRQVLHERIRRHSTAAARQVKMHGKPNDLIERLAADPHFDGVDIDAALDPKKYIGRAPAQVLAFCRDIIGPIRRTYRSAARKSASLHV